MEYIIGLAKTFFFFIGVGIALKWYAKMIAWGIAEGWAKVIHQTTIIHKNEKR